MALESADYIGQLNESYPAGSDAKSSGDDHHRLVKHVLKTTFPGTNGEGYSDVITTTEDQLNALDTYDTDGDNVEDRFSAIELSLTQFDDVDASIAEIQDHLTNSSFPAGTQMLFRGNAAPPYWTKVTEVIDNRMLRVVTGDVSAGGTDSPIICTVVANHTHGFTTNSAGSHSHNASTGSAGSHKHTSSVGTSGSSHRHNIGGGSDAAYSSSGIGVVQSHSSGEYSSTDGSHTHSFSMNNDGSHTHSVSIGSSSSHSHSGTTNSNNGYDNWRPLYYDMILCTKDEWDYTPGGSPV